MRTLGYIILLTNLFFLQIFCLPEKISYKDAVSIKLNTSNIDTVKNAWTAEGFNGNECPGSRFLNGFESICIDKSPCTFKSPTYDIIPQIHTNSLNIMTNFKPSSQSKDAMRLTITLNYDNISEEFSFPISSQGFYPIDINHPDHKLKSFQYTLYIENFCGENRRHHSIKLSYNECKVNQTIAKEYGLIFPQQITAKNNGNRVEGRCITNGVFANSQNRAYITCFSNGSFIENYGNGCICSEGFLYQDNKCIRKYRSSSVLNS